MRNNDEIYQPNPDDPLHKIIDFSGCVCAIRREAFKIFFIDISKDLGIPLNVELSNEQYEQIFPLQIAIELCQNILPVDENDNYGLNKEFIVYLVDYLAREIFTKHANILVDEGIMEMVYLADEEKIGYRLKEN